MEFGKEQVPNRRTALGANQLIAWASRAASALSRLGRGLPAFRAPLFVALALSVVITPASHADEPAAIKVGYLRWIERRQTISLLDQATPDAGLAGAKLAMEDNNSTGRFIGQTYELIDTKIQPGRDVLAPLTVLVDRGVALVMTDAPAATVLKLADAGRERGITLFSVAAPDDSLRGADCRSNVFHVGPSRAMLADALGQYLVWKRWSRWVLAVGSHPEDRALADAYRRTAKRFGGHIVSELTYEDTGAARQTDSGITQTQQQMPVFTQSLPDYDVLVAADENQVFAGYLPFRTWDARPVAGSAGLTPVSWDPSSESWAGTQMQSRFVRTFHRTMTPLDMQAWTAVRMIGDGAAFSKSSDPKAIVQLIRSPEFRLGAHKGEPLSVRTWDGQLRQPILLSDGRNVVSVSPQAGFLHQVTDLDTLGVDQPETLCHLN